MTGRRHFRGLLRLLAAALLLVPAVGAAAAAGHDLRVVIDISGSMKQTDPQNLRVPALRLLSELLPPGTEAGVWTFGQWVNMLVAHGAVDAAWKARARSEAAKISSVALFTDIGQALERATRGWETPADGRRRSLVLLTDGKVDIDKRPELNAQARARILEHQLPALAAAGVTLYPVGLSADVDHELLQRLARGTGGLYQSAASAEDLYRAFLAILEQSAAANLLPIVEGGFEVDAAIDELNIVVFRHPQAERVALRDPDGRELTGEAHPAPVRWFDEPHYTVVTVPDPREGRWQILADPHPDNRVFIVSRLQLHPGALPDTLFAGEEAALEAQLVDGEAPIADSGFLGLLRIQAAIEHEQGTPTVWPLQTADAPGRYTGAGRFAAEAGLSSVSFVAEGPTFHRSVRRLVTLLPAPLTAQWRGPAWVGRSGALEVSAPGAGFASDDLTVSVLWEGPGATRYGAETRLAVGATQTLLFAPGQPGTYQARVAAAGVAADGRGVVLHLRPLSVEARPEPPPAPAAEPAPLPESPPPPAEPQRAGDNRSWLALGAFNLLLALAALYYAWRIRRRDRAALEQRLAQLEAEAAAN